MPAAATFRHLKHEQLACPDTTTVQTATPPFAARAMALDAQTVDVYVTFDGSTPSATNGRRIIAGAQGGVFPYRPPDGNVLKAVSQGAAAKLDIDWLQ